MLTPRWLLVLLAVVVAACGEPGPGSTARDATSTSVFSPVDEQMRLTEQQEADLAEAGHHTEGLLQGVPTGCRLAEAVEGPDQRSAERIVAALGPDVRRGPLVAVDASDGTTVLATTVVAADGSVGDSAAWVAADGDAAAITAANTLAGDLTDFRFEPVDMTAETAVSSIMGGAVDCSWVVADVTHADPPEPEPQMRPDLLTLDPSPAAPGQLVTMHFPEQTSRGVAFQLDRRAGDGWEPVAWMTSDGNGGEPVTVPAFTDGYGVNDVGVSGPGPDHVRLPDDVSSGGYRICTANAGEEFCAPLEVVIG